MERDQVLAMMTTPRLGGMRVAYGDILADGLRRRHTVQQIVGAPLKAGTANRTARSIRYQMTAARLPSAREPADFDFAASPVNEPLIRDPAMAASPTAGATSSWSVAPVPERPISTPPSHGHASARVHAVASTMSSTWSTTLRARPAADARDAPPGSSHAATSPSSTNPDTCPSPGPADSSRFT